MVEIGIGLLTILFAIAIFVYTKHKNHTIGIVIDATPIQDYIFEAKIKLKNGKVIKKIFLTRKKLKRGLKVLIKPIGENLWEAKPL